MSSEYYVKNGVWRQGSYRNVWANWKVRVYSFTGYKDYFFRHKQAANNFIKRVKKYRNYKSHIIKNI